MAEGYMRKRSLSSNEKEKFISRCKKLIIGAGFQYTDGKDIKGKTKFHRKKPDFLAVDRKNWIFLIGEIKTPIEPPTSSSWRNSLVSDTFDFRTIRQKVVELEKCNRLRKEVGGHIIILLGQIMDYFRVFGKTYTFSIDLNRFKIMFAYCVPIIELVNVEKAIEITGIKLIMKLQTCKTYDYKQTPIVFIYEVPHKILYSDATDSYAFEIDISEHMNHLELLNC